MLKTFPSGNDPFVFSDTLELNSTDTSQPMLDRHVNAFNVADFTDAVPAGADALFVTLVVFPYPNAASADASPKAPIVELLKRGASFDGPGAALHSTPDGTDALDLGAGQFVNYTYKDLGGGVFQIVFTPDNVALDAVVWKLRFTINDGVTGPLAQTGLTFVAAPTDSRCPWIAVPGQLKLPPSGPQPIAFAAALAGTSLGGTGAPSNPAPLLGGDTFDAVLPIGNYGTGPLTLTAVTGSPGHLSARLPITPLVIPPGRVNEAAVQVTYAAPAAGETADPAHPAVFALASDDPLAAPSGATAHFSTLSLFASCVPAVVDTWTTRRSMPAPRAGLGAAAAANGSVYAIGGTDQVLDPLAVVEAYDPASNAWTTRRSMPTRRAGARVVSAKNGKIYAIGGVAHVIGLGTVEEYDPATDSWTSKRPMPTARGGLAVAAANNGKIYAVGGAVDQAVISISEEYDPVTNTWATKAPMPTMRTGLGLAAATNGKIYAIGGLVDDSPLAVVEEYDPITDTWSTRAPMPTPRYGLGLAAAGNGKLYAVGGRVISEAGIGTVETAIVEEYDPSTDHWTTRRAMPAARDEFGLAAAANGRLYVIGGSSGTDLGLAVVEEYTP